MKTLNNKFLKNKLWRVLLVSAAAGCIHKLASFVVYDIAYKYFAPDSPDKNLDMELSDLLHNESFLKEYDFYLESRDVFYNYAGIIIGVLALLLFILLCLFVFRDMTKKEIFKSSMVLVVYSFAIYVFSGRFTGHYNRNFFPAYTFFDCPPTGILVLPLYIFGEAAIFLRHYRTSAWIIHPYLSYSQLFEYMAMILPLTFAVFARHKKAYDKKLSSSIY